MAILLSAGLSTRMGRSKALLEWDGVPLVVYQIQQLQAAGVDEVLVVTGHDAEAVEAVIRPTGARAVRNPDYLSGRASSIRAGARSVSGSPEALVLLNVDQPRRAETIRAVLDGHLSSGALITVPAFGGRRGHPAVLSGRLLDELRAVDEESEGLRAIMRRHASKRHEVLVDSEEVLLDVNTPQAYEEARTQTRASVRATEQGR